MTALYDELKRRRGHKGSLNEANAASQIQAAVKAATDRLMPQHTCMAAKVTSTVTAGRQPHDFETRTFVFRDYKKDTYNTTIEFGVNGEQYGVSLVFSVDVSGHIVLHASTERIPVIDVSAFDGAIAKTILAAVPDVRQDV